MEQKAIMYMVLAIISLIFVALLIRKFTFVTNIDQARCQKSIEAHIGLQELTVGDVVSRIRCPTIYQKVKGTNADAVNKQVAEGMRKCWGLWLEGRHPLFKEEGVFCHVCRVFEFETTNQIIPGIQTYMDTHLVPDKSKTYTEYLAPYSTETFEELAPEGFDFSQILGTEEDFKASRAGAFLDTNKDYAAVFVYARGQDFVKNVMDFFGGRTTPLIGGGVMGLAGVSAVSFGMFATVKVLATGSLALGPPGWILGGIAITATGIFLLYEALGGGEVGWMSTMTLVEYNQTLLQNISCEVLPVEQLQK
jgi:hypothetical protein